MATYTPNLDLKKPDGTDFVLVEDFNANSDKVDATIGNPAQLTTEDKTNLVSAINSASKAGVGLNIKGTYDTLLDLQAAVTSPSQGDMYNVGTEAPYEVYMWETIAVSPQWVPQGTIKGDAGVGVPTGGATGQVLKKKSGDNYDTEWGAAGSGVPIGGTTGQILKKQSNTDGDAAWGDAKGVLENTAAIDAMADGDKLIVEDVSAAAGSKIKHVLWSAIKTALLNIFSTALMANTTLYVDTTGSDTTGDGSSGAPYATITKALSVIPKNLNGNTATINVAAGTYAEAVSIAGFYGGGKITLQGDTSLSASRTVNTLQISNCPVRVEVIGTNVASATTSGSVVVSGCAGYVYLQYIRAVNSTTYNGILVNATSHCVTSGCMVSNHNAALYAVGTSLVSVSSWSAGSGNTTGLVSDGSIIFKSTGVPSGTTAETKYTGGQIF